MKRVCINMAQTLLDIIMGNIDLKLQDEYATVFVIHAYLNLKGRKGKSLSRWGDAVQGEYKKQY